jgi:sugar lactone lactonase YvrE
MRILHTILIVTAALGAILPAASARAANAPLHPGEIVITEFFDPLYRINPATGAKTLLEPGTFQPSDFLAVDAARRIVAIDKASQLVRFDPVTKGLTSLTSTLFPSVQGLAIEPSGNVLVVSGDDIFRVNAASGVTTTLVDNANVNGGLFGPKGIAVGPTGRIFVTEFFKFAWEINPATGAASMLSLSRDLVHPNVVEVRSDGDLVVMESNTNLVRISPSSGEVDMMWYGLPGFSKDMAIEADDDVLVTSTSGVFRFDASSGAQSALTWDRPFFNPLAIAVAPGTASPADFNNDGVVNGGDLAMWRNGYGDAGQQALVANADGDGDVDGADFLVWQRQVGGSSAVQSVPEPSTGWLAMTLAIAAIRAGRGVKPAAKVIR